MSPGSEPGETGFLYWFTAAGVSLASFLWLQYHLTSTPRRHEDDVRLSGCYVVPRAAEAPEPRFDIVAVHGMGAHHRWTWIREVYHQDGSVENVHLLEDLLANTYPTARIVHFVHDSKWLVNASVEQTTHEIGQRLREGLLRDREKQTRRLPIVFIGHSFGGIIIKKALCNLADEGRPCYKDHAIQILEDTCGILFLGTPHQGSTLSIYGVMMARIASLVGADSNLLRPLMQHSPELGDLASSFRSIRRRFSNAKIFCLYEKKSSWIKSVPLGLVVNRDSAVGPADPECDIGIDTDHSGLNKCSGLNDPLYKEIVKAIDDMSRPSLLEMADRHVRSCYQNGHTSLNVERLSGLSLPMDQCYINLTIVQQVSRGDRDTDTLQPPKLQHSLLERMNIKEPQTDHTIDLPNLFQARRLRGEQDEKQTKRILIRGRPGVGKTTLCKKIVYDFTHHHLWKGDHAINPNNVKFTRLIWVRLGRLSARSGRYTIEDVLQEEYFSSTGDSKSMVDELSREVSKANAGDSLFLLDGLDEIWPKCADGSALERVVTQLLLLPNVVVTSRPSVKLPERFPFDIELETIGFYSDQVEQYVRAMEPENSDSILSFLKERPLIADLVRIPIQLDALCFAWNDRSHARADGGSKPETMTNLYQAIEQGLWRKDAVRTAAMGQKEELLTREIEQRMLGETILVETLAFRGMREGITTFEANVLEDLSGELPLSLRYGTHMALSNSSFLRSSHVSNFDNSRNYYFLHLTLQEYFAARHLRRQWLDETTKPQAVEFFQQYKYSDRFNIVWRFLAGLLWARPHRNGELFYEIQTGLVDVLGGPVHQQLVMHCLYEIPLSSYFPMRKSLEEQLRDWVLFEFRHFKESDELESLACNMEYPRKALGDLLENSKDAIKTKVLDLISPKQMDERIMELLRAFLNEHQSHDLVKAAMGVFQRLPETSLMEYDVQAVERTFSDERLSIHQSATATMQTFLEAPRLSHLVIEAMEQTLRRVYADYRNWNSALEVLRHHNQLPETALQLMVRILSDEARSGGAFRGVQLDAFMVITNQILLDDSIIRVTVEWFDKWFLGCAASLHNSPPIRQEQLLQVLIRKMEKHYLNSNAFLPAKQELERQRRLPEAVLRSMISKFQYGGATIDASSYAKLRKMLLAFTDIFKCQVTLSEDVVRGIMQVVRDGQPVAQRNARTILEAHPDSMTVVLGTIQQMIEIGDPRSRDMILQIAQINPRLPETVLRETGQDLSDRNPKIRLAAIHVLQYQDHVNIPATLHEIIWQMLDGEDASVLLAVLGILKTEQKLPVTLRETTWQISGTSLRKLWKLLKANNPEVRVAAHAALKVLHFQRGLLVTVQEEIWRLLEDGDPEVRLLSLEALSIQRHLPETLVERLEQSLIDEDLRVRSAALRAIPIGTDLSEIAIEQILQLPLENGSLVPAETVQRLKSQSDLTRVHKVILKTLKSESAAAREIALRMLQVLQELSVPPQAVLEAAEVNVKDQNPKVRSAALEVVQKLLDLKQKLDWKEWSTEKAKQGLRATREDTQIAALDACLAQTHLPKDVLQVVMWRLEQMDSIDTVHYAWSLVETYPEPPVLMILARSMDRESFLACEDWCTLEDRRAPSLPSKLPREVLEVILHSLDTEHAYPESPVYQLFFNHISDWPEDMLHSMVRSLLKHHTDRRIILEWLGRVPELSDNVLRNVSTLFSPKKRRGLGISLDVWSDELWRFLRNHPRLVTVCLSYGYDPSYDRDYDYGYDDDDGRFLGLYRFLIQLGFSHHLVWLHHPDGQDRDRRLEQFLHTEGAEAGRAVQRIRELHTAMP